MAEEKRPAARSFRQPAAAWPCASLRASFPHRGPVTGTRRVKTPASGNTACEVGRRTVPPLDPSHPGRLSRAVPGPGGCCRNAEVCLLTPACAQPGRRSAGADGRGHGSVRIEQDGSVENQCSCPWGPPRPGCLGTTTSRLDGRPEPSAVLPGRPGRGGRFRRMPDPSGRPPPTQGPCLEQAACVSSMEQQVNGFTTQVNRKKRRPPRRCAEAFVW